MEIRHIHYFIAVAENLSFTKAAQQLMIAQPPLSRQIKDLEDELGAALFDRSPHGLHITPEGEAFLEYALRIMDLVKKSREHIAEMSKGLQGTLYIASVEGHAPRLLAEWIADYKTEHPHVDYTLRNGSTDDVIYWVTNGLCELGVITEPHNAEGLFSVPVYTEPWTALIPSSDSLAKAEGNTVSVSDLADRNLIIPSRESRLMEIKNWFPDKNIELHVCCRVAHMLNAYELARQGVGIAIYPASDSHFSGDPDVTIKKLVNPAVTASYILVWDRTHHLTHAAESFVRSICSSAGVPFPGH